MTLPGARGHCWARVSTMPHPGTPAHPTWPGHLSPVCCSLLCPAASLPTPEQNFQILWHEYSHYHRWKHSEVVLNQSEACTLETQPDYSACILPSSSEDSFWRRTSPLYPSTIWSNMKASLKRLERSNLGGVWANPLYQSSRIWIFCEIHIWSITLCNDMGWGQQAMCPETFLHIWGPGLTTRHAITFQLQLSILTTHKCFFRSIFYNFKGP